MYLFFREGEERGKRERNTDVREKRGLHPLSQGPGP